jgi:dihydroorotase
MGATVRFDLLIKGGEVIDPDAGYNGRMDVAVNRDRIAAVEPQIPAKSAFRVIDAAGQYVTPGLIDMHAHIYKDVTYWGVDADAIGSQTGVTTWADAGSAGAMTLGGFREHVVAPSRLKLFSFINITYIGLVAQDYELANNEYCNVEILKRVVNLNRDIVVGIKLRAGRSGGGVDLEPYHRARKAADELELPIMVHLSTAPPDLETVLGFLKPGDIVTHSFTGQSMRLVDEKGKLLDTAKKAWDEGLIMDLGHGAGSFSFDVSEALVSQGYWPDVISTDLHWLSIFGPNLMDPLKGSAFGDLSESSDARSVIVKVKGDGTPVFNLLTCMDKMLFLGMPFPDVIKATTSRPSEILGLKGKTGTLKPGALADIATFVIDKGDFELRDIHKNERRGKERVRNILTMTEGRVLKPIEIPGPPPWVEIVD